MIHYHGTPITPVSALYELAGRHFCVSHAAPQDVARCHAIGQSVMLDNGAFSKWKRDKATDWPSYYEWADHWLGYPTTWAVIPDVIDGGSQLQDALIREWPFGHKGAPVWHMDEPLHRLLRLCGEWPRVCIGSTAEYAVVLSDAWSRRMDECWDGIAAQHRHLPAIHMLRGMQCSGRRWPFASVDSTDIGQNHHRPQNTPRAMADRWDAMQTPGRWEPRPEQLELRVACTRPALMQNASQTIDGSPKPRGPLIQPPHVTTRLSVIDARGKVSLKSRESTGSVRQEWLSLSK